MISIVVPLFNESESLRTLHGEIVATARQHALDVEVVFVDDGSTDGSWDIVCELASRESTVRGIRFRRNFGKAAALAAGFHAARGEVLFMLDADLQDDPAELPHFLSKLEAEKLDVISGWKQVRHDPWHKVLPSRVFNTMVSWMTGVRLHDHNCGMKCLRAEVLREVRLYGELHRFLPVLAAARGFRVGELVIRHRPRQHGHSKYGFSRIFKGFLDLLTVKFLTGYGGRPQHLLGQFGLLSFTLGFVGIAWLSFTWLIRQWEPDLYAPLHQRPLLLYSVAAILMGGQAMSIGLIAELITAYRSRDQDWYSIAEETPDQKTALPPPAAGE